MHWDALYIYWDALYMHWDALMQYLKDATHHKHFPIIV